MKSAIVLAVSAALLMGSELRTPSPEGLTVHEWGTFTSVAGEDGSALEWNALGCTSELPSFVHDYGFRRTKALLRGTVRMETPVIYFYSPRELTANVKVQFPKGAITEWYPRASYSFSTAAGADPLMQWPGHLTSTIEWKDVRVEPGASSRFPSDASANPYYAARGTDAAPLTVAGENEKFLFYRGVASFGIPLSAQISADAKVIVRNRSQEPVPGVIRFENHDGRMSFRIAGTLQNTLTIDEPTGNATIAQLRSALEAELIAQGLYPREAQAMLETWHDSWFEEGSRLIYVVPSKAVDRLLALEVSPTPRQTTRVFVGRIELVTAATRQTVAAAVANKDSATVQKYGRFLDPILGRMNPADSPDTRRTLARAFGVCN